MLRPGHRLFGCFFFFQNDVLLKFFGILTFAHLWCIKLMLLYIDRFQVSHFRPVVMEIEIGGRSERSLGGQESAAVDQECMGSNASSCSFALSFPIRLPFFFFFAGTCLMLGAANSSSPS